MSETLDIWRKRLHMRSIRRGIKEMDVVLGGFSHKHLAELSQEELTVYDRLLHENDHDLYAWVCARTPVPEEFAPLMAKIVASLEK